MLKLIKKIKKHYFQYMMNHAYRKLPDEKYLKKQFMIEMEQKLDFENPKTFNQKLQWLKVNNRKDIYTTMVDKYLVKDYVSKLIGNEYVIKLLGVWESFDDIDFKSLPEKFVLKTTHSSGDIVVCRDKSKLDMEQAREVLTRNFSKNYYYDYREWPYKNVHTRIIAEEYVQNGDCMNLSVYKVFNFNGIPKIIQTIQNDKTNYESIDYFDTDWKLLNLRQNYPNSKNPLSRPETLDEMLKLSAKCSEGLPYLRTDWYEVNGKVYFSEFTFYSDAGIRKFVPEEWDYILGGWITLPVNKKGAN